MKSIMIHMKFVTFAFFTLLWAKLTHASIAMIPIIASGGNAVVVSSGSSERHGELFQRCNLEYYSPLINDPFAVSCLLSYSDSVNGALMVILLIGIVGILMIAMILNS